MRKVLAEFEASRSDAPEAYGDEGTLLVGVRGTPLTLRHERYTDRPFDTLYLFGRPPVSEHQVFLHVFPAAGSEQAFAALKADYERLRKDWRLPPKHTCDASYLAPSATGFAGHEVFRVQDGRWRKRIVHAYEGQARRVLFVLSQDRNDFTTSPLFQSVIGALRLADVALSVPFARGGEPA